ncbi:MAG: hypothetical protein KBA66_09630 [Leptospiraceae bacterium]|nr:hypothetical protein [Leptospiraceae bacterium]
MGSILLLIIFISLIIIPIHLYLNNRGKGQTFLFYAGLLYLVIGLLLLPGFLIYVGIGSSVVGIIYLFLGKKNLPLPLQILTAITPILLFSGLSFYSEPSSNIFLIPKGLTGRIVIIHGCKNGAEKEFDGMSRIYKIPQSGILKTKFSFAGNAFDSLHSKYYYIDSSGNREEILEEANKFHPHGLWTLQHEKKGDTIIDFILDSLQENPHTYQQEKNPLYQKEIDSCLE